MREGLVRKIGNDVLEAPWSLVRQRAVAHLVGLGIVPAVAEWGVDSWGVALGVVGITHVATPNALAAIAADAGANTGASSTGGSAGGAANLPGRTSATDRSECGPTVPPRPGVAGLLLANLLAPGMGTWRCGHRARGAALLGLITVAMVAWTFEILPIIQSAVESATRGNTAAVNRLPAALEATRDGWAYQVMKRTFLYSFVDIWLVYPARKDDPHR